MEEFHGVPHPTPQLDPSPKLGDGPQAKFILRLARKRRERERERFGFNGKNYAHRDGLSRGTILDPVVPRLPPKLGEGPTRQTCIAIGS